MPGYLQGSNERIVMRIEPDLVDVIPQFLENRHTDIASLTQALGCADYQSIRRVGHNLKGVGGAYGFDALTDLGAEIEQAALDSSSERIRYWVAELEAYMRRVEMASPT